MIRSMTGFGEASRHVDGVHYFVEVRSLNSKYFKSIQRLPEELQGLEPEVESVLKRRLSRGTATCTVSRADSSSGAALSINNAALQRYLDQIGQLRPPAGSVPMHVDVASLLSLPGVLMPPADEEERLERGRRVIMPLIEKACDALIEMREREGVSLHAELMAQHALIAERLGVISKQAPAAVTDYESRLRARIDAMLKTADLKVEPADLIREIAVYAERVDIAEEVQRLGAHLEQFKDLVDARKPRPVGRTLDFLAQEMLREANTMASKSPVSEIARATVEIKGAIDRIKEQVQNVE